MVITIPIVVSIAQPVVTSPVTAGFSFARTDLSTNLELTYPKEKE